MRAKTPLAKGAPVRVPQLQSLEKFADWLDAKRLVGVNVHESELELEGSYPCTRVQESTPVLATAMAAPHGHCWPAQGSWRSWAPRRAGVPAYKPTHSHPARPKHGKWVAKGTQDATSHLKNILNTENGHFN